MEFASITMKYVNFLLRLQNMIWKWTINLCSIQSIHIKDRGELIHEGDNNNDINAETIDGKNTFHVMGRVIYQMQAIDEIKCVPDIERLQKNPT